MSNSCNLNLIQTDSKNSRFLPLIIAVSIFIPTFLILISRLNLKWKISLLSTLAGGLVFAPLKNKEKFLFILFLFILPINLDVNFFWIKNYYTTVSGLSISISEIVLAGLYLYWLINRHKTIVFNRIYALYTAIFLLYAAWQLLSITNSKNYALSFFEFKKTISLLFMMIYFFNNFLLLRHLKIFIFVILIALVFQASIGIIEYSVGHTLGLVILGESQTIFEQSLVKSSHILHRVSGLLGHANMYAMYFVLFLPIAFSISLSSEKMFLRIFSFLSFCLGILGLVLSFSRGGIVSLAIAMGLFCVIYNRRIFTRKNVLFILSYLVILICGVIIFWDKIIMRFISSPVAQLSVRYYLNRSALKMIHNHPFLGVGLNNFAVQLAHFDTLGIASAFRFPVHNLYLLIASESGLICLFFFLVFIGMVLLAAIDLYRRHPYSLLGQLALGIFCGITGVLIHSLIDYPLRYNTMYQTFFMVCFVVIVLKWYSTTGRVTW
ncbi:MAG: hypothetical protein B6D56_01430 [Candidatus Omnitrophica bacterium 4484_70.1]|nr:MAG: hypothetical protein B6D56_01430 [Candidatus Omnitrophica bacterium 4484_70.1]